MSKRATAFQRKSTDFAAGHIPPSPNRKYEGASEYSYDTSFVRLSSFILPVPQMFKPTDYLKDVKFSSFEAESYTFSTRVLSHFKKYVDNTFMPWLEENNITKYRIYHLHEAGSSDDSPPNEHMLWQYRSFGGGSYFFGAGVVFKNPHHRLLFKLTF